MEILATLQSLYPTFTKVEKKIADFFMQEQDGRYFPNATMEDVANQVGVGQASVVRLVKKCGYSSYRNFMVDLGRAQYENAVAARLASRQGHSLVDDLNLQLKLCSENLSRENMKLTVQCMRQADLIVCTGYGDSSYVAALTVGRLRREGLFAVQDISGDISLFGRSFSKQLRPMVFAFSVTGETPEIISAVKHYEHNGACVVVLTSHMESTLGKRANITFYTPSKAPKGGKRRDLDGIFNQLYTMEAIIEEYLKNEESAPEEAQELPFFRGEDEMEHIPD
ncbi:MAG: MurR/RpiR family transcriptional regulator [Oscillospiraceae bacterium]|nr:MurR/RpiR family transcriptional regulator [Oscillospiraceae bacterium]